MLFFPLSFLLLIQTCHAVSDPLSEPLSELYSSLPPTPLHTRPETGCETLTPSSPNVLHIEEEEGTALSSKNGAILQNCSLEIDDRKPQPVINSHNAYSLRTDIYLPSFFKMPQVKKPFNVDSQEYFKSANVAQPDGITDHLLGADRSKVIQSHEQVTVDGENSSSPLPCSQNSITEDQLNVCTELGNGYTFTQSPGELDGSIDSNGVLQQHTTFGFQSETGPLDSPWTQESSLVAFPDTSAREQISASRQASLECPVHGNMCMSEMFFL